MSRLKILQVQLYEKNNCVLADQAIIGLPESYEVTNAFLCGQPRMPTRREGEVRTVCFGFQDSWFKGFRLRALWHLYRFCRSEGFDVVVAHRYKPMSLFLHLNRWLRFKRLIGVQHGIGDLDRSHRRREVRRALRENCYVVAVSRAVRQYLINANAGLNEKNCVQIDNAIDIAAAEAVQLEGKAAREHLGLPADKFVIGTIGRLVPVKGHVHLLEAFAKVKDEFPNAVVAIIGEGKSRDELEATMDRLDIQGRVFLLGARPNALQYVRAYNVFVMPSLSEGLPLALLEGMSGHLPVIGSDIPSLLPILEDCGGGIFPVAEPGELAKRLREAMSMESILLKSKGERCYRYLCTSHSIEDYRLKYQKLFALNFEM